MQNFVYSAILCIKFSSQSNALIQVDGCMCPSRGHIQCFTTLLKAFNGLWDNEYVVYAKWPLVYETVGQAVIVMLTSQIYGGI